MDIDAQRAQRLFQAVVTQALVDATNPVPPLNETVREKAGESGIRYQKRRVQALRNRTTAHRQLVQTRDQARSWLTEQGGDFALIVSLAGYNPNDIRERALRLKDKGWPHRTGYLTPETE